MMRRKPPPFRWRRGALAREQADTNQGALVVGQDMIQARRLVQEGNFDIGENIQCGQGPLMHAGGLGRGRVAKGAVADQDNMVVRQGLGPIKGRGLGPICQ